MKIKPDMNRRRFLGKTLLTAAGGLVLGRILTACGGSGGSAYGGGGGTPTTGGNCDSNGTALETTSTTDSHTHTIQLTSSDIVAASTSATFTTSSVGHTHTVQLTAQDYTDLQANTGVTVTTGTGGIDNHTHTVTFNCA